jgi:UDP-N-acetylmuramate--alanine ligase
MTFEPSGSPILKSKVHLIGVAGIGVSGIAEILLGYGAEVSGSDLNPSERTDRLKNLGARVFDSHKKEHVHGADVVVFSSAIASDNPELLEAKKLKIPTIPRAEALAELMRAKRGIAIAGAHGKTTTTSMLASVFDSAGKSPTVVSGGVVVKLGTNAKLGSGEWFIAEADESDGSFEKLSPVISVITNIDNDHLEHYGSYEKLISSFLKFADRIPFYGTVVYCGDDEDCREAFKSMTKKTISYGFNEANDFCIKKKKENIYEVFFEDKALGFFSSPLPGDYNALNSLAAIVVGMRAGIEFDEVKKGVESFKGVKRRFEVKLDDEEKDIMILDDYAHHPTEIFAVLGACKQKYLGAKIKCVFQPHRYTRLKNCWDQFLNAFDECDELFILPVYEAGESPVEGFDSESLSESVNHTHANYINENDFESITSKLYENLNAGDLLITLGAGNVYKIADALAKKVQP